jgi:integration host factor subunit alpha
VLKFDFTHGKMLFLELKCFLMGDIMAETSLADHKTLTKADIAESICLATGFSKKDSAEIVEKVFEGIKKALERGEDVKLSGFGKFEVRQKRKRRGRNPQTGDAIEISARKVLSFRSSQILRQSLIESGK